MLFASLEAHIVKICDRGLENTARGCRPRATFSSPRSQFFTIRTDPKPVNNLFIFSKLSNEKKKSRKKTHASVTVTVVRDRKIWTVLRTNQIVGFVTAPAWKKIKSIYSVYEILWNSTLAAFSYESRRKMPYRSRILSLHTTIKICSIQQVGVALGVNATKNWVCPAVRLRVLPAQYVISPRVFDVMYLHLQTWVVVPR